MRWGMSASRSMDTYGERPVSATRKAHALRKNASRALRIPDQSRQRLADRLISPSAWHPNDSSTPTNDGAANPRDPSHGDVQHANRAQPDSR